MSPSTRSWQTVPYDLRAAKQIERRMIIDALQGFAIAGFDIRKYLYLGMGSIYFVDFILFHKWLGIDSMISAERDVEIVKRVDFNRPFRRVQVEPKPIGELIASLPPEAKVIVWFDYDDTLRAEHLRDLLRAGTYLSRESIILVTVEAGPPRDEQGNRVDDPRQWKEYFEREAGDYLGRSSRLADFAQSKLQSLNLAILVRAIKRGLSTRQDQFLPLFYFSYADGREMLTIGGMIGRRAERTRIARSSFLETPYARIRFRDGPFRITVPRVTRKERLHLDSAMPCADTWLPGEFELDSETVRTYRDVYRFLPAYAELLL
jgi:hypothetical protein